MKLDSFTEFYDLTKGNSNRPDNQSKKNKLRIYHQCNYCEKHFLKPSALKAHILTHTGEKPFKCTSEGCGRAFSILSNLRRHTKYRHAVKKKKETYTSLFEKYQQQKYPAIQPKIDILPSPPTSPTETINDMSSSSPFSTTDYFYYFNKHTSTPASTLPLVQKNGHHHDTMTPCCLVLPTSSSIRLVSIPLPFNYEDGPIASSLTFNYENVPSSLKKNESDFNQLDQFLHSDVDYLLAASTITNF